jgi:hypothetical protein
MVAPRLSISAGVPGGCVCLRLLVAVFVVLILPAQGRALDVLLRWAPSLDAGVQGYYVYVREATRPYGAPRDVGAGSLGGDGSRSWTLSGLSPTANYFVAVSAYNGDRIESALSNELAIGSQNLCVADTCTSPTQCTVRTLPDGSGCGPPGAGACGAACLGGVCTGPASRALTLDRVRLKRSDDELKITVEGRFTTSALFDPLAAGLQLTVADPAGALLAQASLAPGDLSADGSDIKTARRADDAAPVRVRRLVLHVRTGDTRLEASLNVAPPPPALPPSATVTLQSGGLCLSAAPLDCVSRKRGLSCR